MRVVITGSSHGIGLGICKVFLKNGHDVFGLDREKPDPSTSSNSKFHFFMCDVGDLNTLPNLDNINIIINNAGSLVEEEALTKKLMGMYYVTEKYAFQQDIKSVVNIGSNSAYFGIEFPMYAMCNGAVLSYTKNLARRLGKMYQATVNSVSPGYADTRLDEHLKDENLDKELMNHYLIKHIQSCEEIGDLVYYMSVVNESITGQDILMDNGEALNSDFVETKENLKKFYNSMLRR